MGTTRTMLEAGSANFVFVVAIEGYDELLTNAEDTAAVVTAWSGSDWTAARGGLFVDLKLDQKLDPDRPFGSMGNCTLWVLEPADDDAFGVATHRRTSSAETYLAATCDHNDTTITVQSTAAFASSGYIHIGTECIAYSGKTSTTFTGCDRGQFSPAGTDADPDHFGRSHDVTTDANSVQIQPRVTSTPRQWKGRFVSVYAHRVSAGVLDVKSEAERVFAGTIGDIRDDQQTGATIVEVRSIMEWIGERVVGDNMAGGHIEDGVFLKAGMRFSWHEHGQFGSTTYDNSVGSILLVVASGALPTYEINAGFYTASEICTFINTWINAEITLGNLDGSYSIASPVTSPQGLRTKVYYSLALDAGYWRFELPKPVADFFGFADNVSGTSTPGHVRLDVTDMGVDQTYYDGSREPMRLYVALGSTLNDKVEIAVESGVLLDQYDRLPSSIKPSTRYIDGDAVTAWSWGLFIINNSSPILAAFDANDPTYLIGLRPWIGLRKYRLYFAEITYIDTIGIGSSDSPVRFRQILAIEQPNNNILLGSAMSTGTAGYNSALFDVYPAPFALGLPAGYVGNDFASEVPNGAASSVVVLEKPTRFSEVVSSDLVIRWGFLKWQDGALRYGAWRSPTALESVLDIDDTSKAEPGGHKVSHVSASAQTDEMQKSIVKVEFNREFADPSNDKYNSYVMFHDRGAVSDEGGSVKVHTISMANTFEEFASTGASVEALLPAYLARMPIISRPVWLIERSIDPANFWKLTIGDIVTFTDPHARNPSTGERGITSRPALVTRLTFSPGGKLPSAGGASTVQPMGGRVTLLITETDPDRTGIAYAPAANVDATANPSGFSNGYNSSTFTLRTVAHAYSNSTEDGDATHFDAGDEVLIVERDPYDPDNPIVWQRTVDTQSGTDITLTTGLSSPAWDATKQYVVLFADYADVQASQQTHTFQADDATGLIQSTAQPYLYGSGNAEAGDANDTESPELPSARIGADGAGRCVYGDTQLIRLIDNFIDYKSTTCDSFLLQSVQSNSDAATSTGYKLVAYWPVFLNYEQLSNSVYRYITAAVWAGSTDGTSTKVRVRLRRTPPTETTLYNVSPVGDYATAEWTGITNTTLTTLASATTLTVNVKNSIFAGDSAGLAYVTLELGYKASTRGIAMWSVGARQTI